jgi:GxxExxY protein
MLYKNTFCRIIRDESFKIQGAVYSVYREMGAGFLEAVYQECLEIEFVKFPSIISLISFQNDLFFSGHVAVSFLSYLLLMIRQKVFLYNIM